MIKVSNLTKSYGAHKVLKDINISFDPGQVYGIAGENGAGKTTFFNCLAGLESYSGNIYSNLTPLKNHLGLLPTNPFFFPKLTGAEYLTLMALARNKSNIDLKAKNIFSLPLHQYADTYSTGMQKKLALTGILIQENDIYILDEPFNGVDIRSNMIISAIIDQLRTIGKTVIIASHIFSTLSDSCNEIHLLKEGVFIQKALKEEFKSLDDAMKHSMIGDRLELFDLK